MNMISHKQKKELLYLMQESADQSDYVIYFRTFLWRYMFNLFMDKDFRIFHISSFFFINYHMHLFNQPLPSLHQSPTSSPTHRIVLLFRSFLLEVWLPCDPSCPSVGGLVCRCVCHNFLKGGKLHFHGPVRALVFTMPQSVQFMIPMPAEIEEKATWLLQHLQVNNMAASAPPGKQHGCFSTSR